MFTQLLYRGPSLVTSAEFPAMTQDQASVFAGDASGQEYNQKITFF